MNSPTALSVPIDNQEPRPAVLPEQNSTKSSETLLHWHEFHHLALLLKGIDRLYKFEMKTIVKYCIFLESAPGNRLKPIVHYRKTFVFSKVFYSLNQDNNNLRCVMNTFFQRRQNRGTSCILVIT